MSAPVALIQFAASGQIRLALAGAGPIRFIVIDEGAPGDRLYEVSHRLSDVEFAALVPPGAPIGDASEPRHAALAARVEAACEGRRHLRSVE
jgi:hypothetical protein